MKAVILAAGQGTRLRPLTYGIPKPLLPVGGKPVIDYVIDNLVASKQINEIYVAVSQMHSSIENYFQHTPRDRVKIETVATLGWETGGDLRMVAVEKELTKEKGPVFVAYGDVVTDIDVSSIIQIHKNSDNLATLALFPVPKEDISRMGIATIEGGKESGKITSFIEKPQTSQSNLASTAYYILQPEVFEMLPANKIKVEHSVFPKLVEQGRMGGIVVKPRYWLDIGTIESYRKANKMIIDGIVPP